MFYICASYDRRGRAICDNGLRLPLTLADDAILSRLRGYVLDPEIVEGAIVDALAELQPSRDDLATRRSTLESEIRKLEEEQARFVAAIAIAGQVEALAEALRDREQQRTRLRSELALLARADEMSTFDVKRIDRAELFDDAIVGNRPANHIALPRQPFQGNPARRRKRNWKLARPGRTAKPRSGGVPPARARNRSRVMERVLAE